MSAKVYTGFRCQQTDYANFVEKMSEWHPTYIEHVAELDAELYARKSANIIDLARAGLKSQYMPVSPIVLARNAILTGRQKGTHSPTLLAPDKQVDPEIDKRFCVRLYLHADTFYACATCAQPLFIDSWAAFMDAVDFSYTKGAESPDDVDAEDWKNRAYMWNEVLCSDKYRNTSSVFNLDSHRSDPSIAHILAAMPSIERRQHDLAQELVYAEIMQEASVSDSPSSILNRAKLAQDEIINGDTARALRAMRKAQSIVITDLTADDLTEALPATAQDFYAA